MYNRILAVAIAITGYFISNPHPLLGQEPQLTIRVLASFDYPGSGNSTTVQGINDHGDVVGYFEDGTRAVRSFIRFADGTFSAPIVEPNDTGNFTVAKGINNSGDICGYYVSSDIYYPYRGFILSATTFTEYGAGGFNYYLSGITDAGDYCGYFSDYRTHLFQSFLFLADGREVGWVINNFCEANAVNTHGATVGDSRDSLGWHGFFRATGFPVARILSPVDYPGSTSTFLLGLNDGGDVIVGKYVDSMGATHGLVLQRPDTWTSFDYPGAVETSLNGINNHKIVSGYYTARSGIHHGFIGKVIELR